MPVTPIVQCVQLPTASVQLHCDCGSVLDYLLSSGKAPRQLTGSEDRRYRYTGIAEGQ